MTVIGEALLRVRPETAGFEGEVKSKIGGAFGGVAKFAAGAFAAVRIGGFLKGAVGEAEEARKVLAQTEAVIKSTGGAAGVTAKQVDQLSESLSKQTGVDDEAIGGLQNLLLTFTNVKNGVGAGNDIFNQTTAIALDMAAALGTDASGSAIQLGKALNNPTQGLTALTRVGVTFTDQQKEQIKTLQENGDLMGAQKIILAELTKEFGGSAAAQAGPLDKLRVTWGNLKEEVGKAVLPILGKAADFMNETLPRALASARRAIQPVLVGIRAFAAAFSDPDVTSDGFVGVMERIGVVARQVFDTVGRIVRSFFSIFRSEGDKASGTTSKLGEILKQLLATFRTVFEAIGVAVSTAVAFYSELWDRFGSTLIDKIRIALNAVLQVIQGVLQVIQGVLNVFIGIFTGDWSRAWDGIKGIVEGAWNIISGVVKAAINGISTAIGAGMAVISAVWSGAWNAVKAFLGSIWDGIKSVVKGGVDALISFVKSIPGAISSVIKGAFDAIPRAFKAAINVIIRAWNGLEFKIPGFDPPGPGPKFGGFTLGVPNIPLLHSGGIFRAPGGAREGLALLEDGERVISRSQSMGPMTVQLVVDGRVVASALADPMADALRRREQART